jgi:hypothetical protein
MEAAQKTGLTTQAGALAFPSAFPDAGGGPRVALAPMSGITDHGLRRDRHAASAPAIVVSEMVASDEFVKGHEETRLRAEGAGVTPHVVQLGRLRRGAGWLTQHGSPTRSGADVIDINMGCPAKRVTGGWAGSALDARSRSCNRATCCRDRQAPRTSLSPSRCGWAGITDSLERARTGAPRGRGWCAG